MAKMDRTERIRTLKAFDSLYPGFLAGMDEVGMVSLRFPPEKRRSPAAGAIPGILQSG